jgi:hypothetical protein
LQDLGLLGILSKNFKGENGNRRKLILTTITGGVILLED